MDHFSQYTRLPARTERGRRIPDKNRFTLGCLGGSLIGCLASAIIFLIIVGVILSVVPQIFAVIMVIIAILSGGKIGG